PHLRRGRQQLTVLLNVLGLPTLCQLAELTTIPLSHIGEMAVDFLAPLGNDPLLLFELLGLLREALRRRGDLLSLLLDLGLAPLQARLIAGQGELQLTELSLPVEQLLAESGNRQAVLVLGYVQGLLLPSQRFLFGAGLAAQRF